MIIEFEKPYVFEGEEYASVNLDGLDNLTIQDAIDAQLTEINHQNIASSMLCETTSGFIMDIAAKASGMPVEFFKYMPIRLGKQVRLAVMGYLNIGAGNDGSQILKLQKPYTYDGVEYTQFDLSGINDMTMMQEAVAENELAKAGFTIIENSFNYLYVCVIAAMAVNKPKEIFTNLPISELSNLKNTVSAINFS